MLERMKVPHTDACGETTIIIKSKGYSVSYVVSNTHVSEVETFVKAHSSAIEKGVEWSSLAKERLEKHKKAGLVLRGIRCRDNISQKELASRSGVSQNEISKIENGKRVVGEKVAKRLATALNIDYLMLMP